MINYQNMLNTAAPQTQSETVQTAVGPQPVPGYEAPNRPGSKRFQRAFQKLLTQQGKTLRKNPPGVDSARPVDQVAAAYKGGFKQGKPAPLPGNGTLAYAAVLQNSLRDKSREQGSNQYRPYTPVASGTSRSTGASLRPNLQQPTYSYSGMITRGTQR